MSDKRPANLPCEVLNAIDRVVEYLYHEERQDFENTDNSPLSRHIFHDLRRIRDWLQAEKKPSINSLTLFSHRGTECNKTAEISPQIQTTRRFAGACIL